MRIGTCQTREIFADVDEAVRVVRGFAGRATAAGVDLLLFPEGFLQGYLTTDHFVRDQALDIDAGGLDPVLASLAGVPQMLVFGMIERAGDRFHNTAVVIDRGRVAGRYRKTFLTAGESMFTAGAGYPVFERGGVRFGVNICFDTQFPQAAAAVAAGGAQVLLVPAQNMMRRETALRWQHRHNEIRACRARETGMWVVSADVTGERDGVRLGLGPTGFLDPAGVVVAQVPAGETGMVTADVG